MLTSTSVLSWGAASLLALLAMTLVACATVKMPTRPPLPFAAMAGPVIIAHRGGSLEAPENTLASMRHAIDAGADWQELDVGLSCDDQVMVIHDDTLERTTHSQGHVEERTAAELTALGAGKPGWPDYTRAALAERNIEPTDFQERFAGERVPTLSQVLALPNGRFMIEMKRTARVERLAERVIDVVYESGAADRVALASFDENLLDEAYRRDASLPLVGLAGEEEAIEKMLQVPISVLAVRTTLAASALKAAPPTVAVWVWTVYNLADAAALRDLGVHGLITDIPKTLVGNMRAEPDIYVRPSE